MNKAANSRKALARTLALIGAGALAATGFQPLGFWPFTLAALAFLIARPDRAPSARNPALAGWPFGPGHFALGNPGFPPCRG